MANHCAFGLLLLAFGAHANVEDNSDFERSCSEGECKQETGRALLQVRRDSTFSITTQSQAKSLGLGSTLPVNSTSFDTVKGLCCSEEMLAFAKRLVEEEEYILCLVGGLSGTILFYDCVDNDPPENNFTMLKEALKKGADPNSDCPYLVGKDVGQCPPRSELHCTGFPDASFPPCKDDLDYICCGNVTDLDVYPQSSKSAIVPWDCKGRSGPIQVLAAEDNKSYHVSELDLETQDYKELFNILLLRPDGTKMDLRMNAVAVNPVDGIAYGIVSINQEYYIARFDDTIDGARIEYVAKLSPLAAWFDYADATEDKIYLGSISQSGTYFLGGHSKKNNGNDILAVKNISDYDGFASHTDSSLPTLTKEFENVTSANLDISGCDCATAIGDFDDSGEENEWLFILRGNFDLLVAEVGHLPNMTFHKLTTNHNDGVGEGEGKKAFGAAWSYENQIYFSRNNGDGVYKILTDSLNVHSGTYSIQKVVDKTPKTNNNDGMNCMNSKPPFPGECKPPEVEIDMVDGKCPGNSNRVPKQKRNNQRSVISGNPFR